jgi:hypothetical protein
LLGEDFELRVEVRVRLISYDTNSGKINSAMTAIDGAPLSPEALRMLDYLRSRAVSLDAGGIRERIRAAAHELESAAGAVSEAEARLRPIANKWTIAEVVDHIAQTQARGAEELRHLLAGRRPPAPPVYEALRSGAAEWAPWPELIDGLHAANDELVAVLAAASDETQNGAPTVQTILVVTRNLPAGGTGPQIFVEELGWKEYAILQRLHLLDHRTQIKNLRAALNTAG